MPLTSSRLPRDAAALAMGVALGALVALDAARLSAAPADPGAARPAFPQDATIVLRLAERPGEVLSDQLHVLEIRGDGRIRIQRPSYMKGSREAESRLAPAELDEVIDMLAGHGVLDFDVDAARARFEQARAARFAQALEDPAVEIMDATDPDATSLEVRFERIAAGEGRAARREMRRIDWIGLRADARFYPECPELAALAQAQAALWRLAERPGLE